MESSISKRINQIKENSFMKILLEYSRIIIVILFCAYIALILYYTAKTPETLMSKPFTISVLVIVPVILIALLYIGSGELNLNYKIIIGLIVLGISAFIAFLLYFYITSSKKNVMTSAVSYIAIGIVFAIILVGLMIYYNVFINSIKKQRGWSGFITKVLFYLPCLISDYFRYLFQEATTTPPIVFVLFIIEICLLLLYVYLPTIVNAVFIPKGVLLLGNPVFLTATSTVPNQISTGDTFLLKAPIPTNTPLSDSTMPTIDGVIPQDIYNNNFSLSMWIFINNTVLVTNEQESILFKYASPGDFYGKPCITYLGNDDWRFMFTNNIDTIPVGTDLTKTALPEYIIKMPSQKWHHVVFSYYENKVDLYLNGSLARSMDLSNRLPKKFRSDIITIGDKRPLNIPGAICNINYYETRLTSAQISRIYNMLFKFNPPVNNLR